MGVFVESTRTDGRLSCLQACDDRLMLGSFTYQRFDDSLISFEAAVLKLNLPRAILRTKAPWSFKSTADFAEIFVAVTATRVLRRTKELYL